MLWSSPDGDAMTVVGKLEQALVLIIIIRELCFDASDNHTNCKIAKVRIHHGMLKNKRDLWQRRDTT